MMEGPPPLQHRAALQDLNSIHANIQFGDGLVGLVKGF